MISPIDPNMENNDIIFQKCNNLNRKITTTWGMTVLSIVVENP
jgi:hypothetical protein